MGKETEQTFLQRRFTISQQVYEKMLNSTNHQGNANKSHNDILPFTYQHGYPQKKKKKISSVVEGVEKIELPYDTEILLLNIYPKEMKSILQRAMYYI